MLSTISVGASPVSSGEELASPSIVSKIAIGISIASVVFFLIGGLTVWLWQRRRGRRKYADVAAPRRDALGSESSENEHFPRLWRSSLALLHRNSTGTCRRLSKSPEQIEHAKPWGNAPAHEMGTSGEIS